jgi:hypothetical protein
MSLVGEAIAILFKYLQLPESDKSEFLNYCTKYFNYSASNKNQLKDSEIYATCFGNLWHTYRFYKDGGMVGVTRFYQNRGVLPENIYIEFTYPQRQLLVGSTIIDEYLMGEDQIDVAQTHGFCQTPRSASNY